MSQGENDTIMSPDLDYLLKYMEKRFDAMDGRFTHLEQEFVELQTAVDAYAKRADAFFQEMVMLSHKVDRHERWLHQIAEKLGVKLEY
jgi:hypothetical protein